MSKRVINRKHTLTDYCCGLSIRFSKLIHISPDNWFVNLLGIIFHKMPRHPSIMAGSGCLITGAIAMSISKMFTYRTKRSNSTWWWSGSNRSNSRSLINWILSWLFLFQMIRKLRPTGLFKYDNKWFFCQVGIF